MMFKEYRFVSNNNETIFIKNLPYDLFNEIDVLRISYERKNKVFRLKQEICFTQRTEGKFKWLNIDEILIEQEGVPFWAELIKIAEGNDSKIDNMAWESHPDSEYGYERVLEFTAKDLAQLIRLNAIIDEFYHPFHTERIVLFNWVNENNQDYIEDKSDCSHEYRLESKNGHIIIQNVTDEFIREIDCVEIKLEKTDNEFRLVEEICVNKSASNNNKTEFIQQMRFQSGDLEYYEVLQIAKHNGRSPESSYWSEKQSFPSKFERITDIPTTDKSELKKLNEIFKELKRRECWSSENFALICYWGNTTED